MTREIISDLLSYEPETGKLRWRVRASSRAGIGAVAGSQRSDGYISVNIGGERHYAHRLAWRLYYGTWPNGMVDHVDRDPSNNRISNLRLASNVENAANGSGPPVGRSGYRGVVWHSRDRVWQARIRVGTRRVSLGTYREPYAAARAYDAAAKIQHGPFAILNFPTES